MKLCIDCNLQPKVERKRCVECCKIYNKEKAKEYYSELKKKGIVKKRYGFTICVFCKQLMVKNRPNHVAHGACKNYGKIENYNKVPRVGVNTKGRQTILSLGLDITGFDVHHIDEDPYNNSLSNLLILKRPYHTKLHTFLKDERATNWLALNENEENWNVFRRKITLDFCTKRNLIQLNISNFKDVVLSIDNIYLIQC